MDTILDQTMAELATRVQVSNRSWKI